MGSGVGQQALERLLIALDHVAPADDNRKLVETYDAGLLNDFGGGNVEWWQDYIRAELGRAHDHYTAQMAADDNHKALVEAWAPFQDRLTVFPHDLDEGDDEEVEISGIM